MIKRLIAVTFTISLLAMGASSLSLGQSEPTQSGEEAPVIKAGVQWDEDKARETALRHIERQIDMQTFKAKDDQYFDRMRLKFQEPDLKFANQQTTWFENGEYSVAFEGEKRVNYYRQNGDLFKVSVCNQTFGDNSKYPRRCIEYAYPEGKFQSVSMDISPDESYVFDLKGQLLQHWKDDQGFSAKDNTNWTRWNDKQSNDEPDHQ